MTVEYGKKKITKDYETKIQDMPLGFCTGSMVQGAPARLYLVIKDFDGGGKDRKKYLLLVDGNDNNFSCGNGWNSASLYEFKQVYVAIAAEE